MSDSVAMSFKAKMKNLAAKLGLRPQTVIQNFMFERFLERLSKSDYRDNFVVKGGVLISAMIGLKAHAFMGLVKTRRLAAMQKHPPSPRLRRTGQRAKAGAKNPPRPSKDCVQSAKAKRRMPAF